ncbi:MAG: Histidine ammonia-lyase [Bacteroidota bacterium]|jgi:histidine ammonia-lyase
MLTNQPDHHEIGGEHQLTVKIVEKIISKKLKIKLSEAARERVQRSDDFLQQYIAENDRPIYGINTGFGSLCDIKISNSQIIDLQHNLIRSHACGTGAEVPAEVVRLMLLLKIQGLSHGHSGVRVALLERLIAFFNDDALPIIYELGSLGASGDLAPLAHLSLPLIGEGEMRWKGKKISPSEYLAKQSLSPLELTAKEGLALLNGTQFSASYGIALLMRARHLMNAANAIAALSIDAFDALLEPFDAKLHDIRQHRGQQKVAASVRKWLDGSAIIGRPKKVVQDPYSFRCVPQVHGASWQAIRHVKSVFEREINAVTDNPTIFPDENQILSGGNFHAQNLAIALDYLAIALSELASISERRIFQLISGKRDLPPFLVNDAGLQSGLMIVQYTAASVASQNKQLCTPASADSIVSCNGQEDHVSMAANGATKCMRIAENVTRILAMELLTAAQGLEFRRPARTSDRLEKLVENYRKSVPKIEADRILHFDIEKSIRFLKKKSNFKV